MISATRGELCVKAPRGSSLDIAGKSSRASGTFSPSVPPFRGPTRGSPETLSVYLYRQNVTACPDQRPAPGGESRSSHRGLARCVPSEPCVCLLLLPLEETRAQQVSAASLRWVSAVGKVLRRGLPRGPGPLPCLRGTVGLSAAALLKAELDRVLSPPPPSAMQRAMKGAAPAAGSALISATASPDPALRLPLPRLSPSGIPVEPRQASPRAHLHELSWNANAKRALFSSYAPRPQKKTTGEMHHQRGRHLSRTELNLILFQ
ncbi:hypothetical protein SKAU_G00008360 [Synaphobranchus kaupii]|uniref:Uncharacterized protein n=1 Tax=Synaphobranchus kaupii TaxID=118154 RepID=A0A9Q1GAQ4_SYNKA|nr:hypothetical protein SKAU_G00008360 [Synaphobranchus kaupii]